MRHAFAVAFAILLAAGCAEREPIATQAAPQSGIDWANATVLVVELHEFGFAPERLILEAERPYRLQVRNAGELEHTLTAPGFFTQAALRDDPASERVLQHGGVLEVPSGETADLYLVAPQKGTFETECSEPLHALGFGMRGAIVVQ